MRVLILTLFVVVADQFTKLMVKGISIPWLGINFQGVPLGSSRMVFGDFLRLTYIENPGMAFGIDLGGKMFFSLVSIIASIAIVLYLYKMRKEPLLYRISLSLILGGAIGNLIDRTFYGVIFNEGTLFHGRVVDFIDADFFNINLFGYHLNRWPVFNIADAAVTCGVILLLFVHRTVTMEPAQSTVEQSPSDLLASSTAPDGYAPPSPDSPAEAEYQQ